MRDINVLTRDSKAKGKKKKSPSGAGGGGGGGGGAAKGTATGMAWVGRSLSGKAPKAKKAAKKAGAKKKKKDGTKKTKKASAMKLERLWRDAKGDGAAFADGLDALGVAPAKLRGVLKESLSEDTFGALLAGAAARAGAPATAPWALGVLEGLAAVKRFDTMAMFMGAAQKDGVAATMAQLGLHCGDDEARLGALRAKYLG